MKIGIVGVSGYGGSELLRLVAGHPGFELAYVGGESTAGQALAQRFPALAGHAAGKLVIEPFVPEGIPGIDLLFASLPTGKSREPLAKVAKAIKVVDVGGDHRFVEGWTYGLTELPGQRDKIRGATRIANPGCYPAAALLALAPLLKEGLIEPEGIVIDAKSGVTGTGRGGASDFGYAETNEDLFAYGLEAHPHVPEIEQALAQVAGRKATVAFTPHLVPMTRGILATCYAHPKGAADPKRLYAAAEAAYRDEPFVKLVPLAKGRSAHTGWATGSNLAFLSYAVNTRTGLVVALGAIDNLGKGASAQALQNANLMTGHPETAGLAGLPLWP
ncbi:MAG: N-acetyl-gamma-glutamyl-phosphate reductase [Betaproteobacteria bacterium]|nr:N-acetyl-gamma-glutamyl-phosphate reductase [Betaproteobacteria bacterium]MDH4325180.1 N-acetyl-gamma-glutamyl-phosphate reductase [Betaproteobacteria bacterium]